MTNRKLFIICSILFLALPSLIPQALNAGPTNWHWRNPLPQGNTLFGTAYGNGVYVAVGEAGTILNFSIGIAHSGIIEALRAVAYGDNTFVAVGDYGAILTSSDGVNWTLRNPLKLDAPCFVSVVYGNNTFVAVSRSGDVYASHDKGITWGSKRLLDPQYYSFTHVTFANNLFVAVGTAAKIFTSPDGFTWTDASIPSPIAYSDSHLIGIVYGQGVFVAISLWGEVFTSPDTVTWTREPHLGITDNFYGLAYGNGTFVAVGTTGVNTAVIYSSPDGETWTKEWQNPMEIPLYGVAFVNGRFMATGGGGQILKSVDGEIWTDITFRITANSVYSVAYGNDIFIAVAYSHYPSDNPLFSSPDGIIWTQLPPLANGIGRVKFVNGMFYMIRSDSLLASQDGVSWTTVLSESGISFTDLTFANNTYVLIGANHSIKTSPDMITWTGRWNGPEYSFRAVTFGNNTFVVAGDYGTIVTSQDGITWTKEYIYANDDFTDISFGNNQFVVVGYYGTIYSSPNGKVWQNRVEGWNTGIRNIISAEDGFLAVGTWNRDLGLGPVWYGLLYTSLDGITWTISVLAVNGSFLGVAYGMEGYVVVGTDGIILQAEMESVSPPTILEGPKSTIVNKSNIYSTGGSSSSTGHPIQYRFDWGDGTTSGWLAAGTISASKSWVSSGLYDVKVQARCAHDTTNISPWSQSLSVAVSVFSVVSPNGGETLTAGTTQTIRWSYGGNPGASVKLELLKGGIVNRIIKSFASKGSGGNGSFDWLIPPTQVMGSDYRIRITSTRNGSYTDTSDNDFIIVGPTPPTISVVSPNGGDSWTAGTTQTIQWTYTGNPGSHLKIELLKAGVVNRIIRSFAPTGSGGNGSFDWHIPSTQAPGSDYKIRVTSTSNNSYSDTSDTNFEIGK